MIQPIYNNRIKLIRIKYNKLNQNDAEFLKENNICLVCNEIIKQHKFPGKYIFKNHTLGIQIPLHPKCKCNLDINKLKKLSDVKW